MATSRAKPMLGLRFGALVVVARAGTRASSAVWRCKCDCGGEAEVTAACLRGGDTRSCGCQRYSDMSQRMSRHGHTRGRGKSPEYASWCSMWQRCSNPEANAYEDYGSRGITVCERWSSFDSFLSDMGERPPGTSIDRIDVNGNYEPGNCRWATPAEQAQNRRTSKLTAADVRAIRRLVGSGRSQRSVSRAFDVSHGVVGQIVRRRTWRNVP